jgi:Domain of unknown function (DUF4262)
MDDGIAEDIRNHGWSALDVYDAAPPFIYTVGLTETWNHPELIVFGMPPKSLSGILSAMVHTIKGGATYAKAGTYSGILQGDTLIGVRAVDPTQHQVYLGYAMGRVWVTNRNLEAMQVFWPDKAGKFPYEVGCDLGVYNRQPRLDLALTPSEIAEFERQWGQ